MRLFGKSNTAPGRCPDCQYYVFMQSKAYCSKSAPANVNIRQLSEQGIARVCVACPSEMTCADFQAKGR